MSGRNIGQLLSGRKETDCPPGVIEVITGGMFCGKSDELIRRLRRGEYARIQVQAFKPLIDDRRGFDTINTFDGAQFPATSVEQSEEILKKLREGVKWVGIDEAQFMDKNLPDVVRILAGQGRRVIVAGLAADFRNKRFGPMDELMREADDITKLPAYCAQCGQEATRTQRLVNGKPANYNDPVVLVGEKESYEPRCRDHHEVPGRRKSVIERRFR